MPKQLECIYTNEILGLVRGNCYYTSTTIENDFFTYHCGNKLAYLEQIISIDSKTAIMKKVPFLRSNDEIALQPVSISHHGRYDQTIALKFKVFYLRPSLDFSFKREVQFYMHPLMRSFFRF
jgi:hypothetical protein